MSATATKELLRERQLDRMRAGQAIAEIVPLVSDPEIRVALVPLREADYKQALSVVARIDMADTMAALQYRDRVNTQELLARSLRDPSNLDERLFSSAEEMIDLLEVADIDRLIDDFNEMSDKSNPSLDGIPDEEFVALKKVLQVMDWSALSGKSWFAAKRFLGALTMQGLLSDNSPGSTSTNPLTTTSENERFTPTA